MNDMTDRPIQSASLDKLLPALLLARKSMSNPTKDKKNPGFTNSKYADLSSCKEAGDDALAEHGLFVNDIRTNDGGGYEELVTTLWHAPSGQFLRAYARLNPAKADPQGYGSAITYSRRYSYTALTGLAPEDDDGNAASGVQLSEPAAKLKPATAAPQPNPVFPNETQIVIFQESVRRLFAAAASPAELTEVIAKLKPQMEQIEAGGHPPELVVLAALRLDFKDRMAALKTPAKPTVSDVIGGDSLPDFA